MKSFSTLKYDKNKNPQEQEHATKTTTTTTLFVAIGEPFPGAKREILG